MSWAGPVVIVSGFLGAGKSRVVEAIAATASIVRLAQSLDLGAGAGILPITGATNSPLSNPAIDHAIDTLTQHGHGATSPPDAVVIEASSLRDPRLVASACPAGSDIRIVTVVDAVNMIACLQNSTHSEVIRAQLLASDCVVLARGDVIDPADARAAVAEIASSPILEAQPAALSLAEVLGAGKSPRTGLSERPIDRSGDYAIWTYRGPGVMTPEAAEAFLRDRPKATYRINGRVKTSAGGMDLQLVGRARQTTRIAPPDETVIIAAGTKPGFNSRDMDWAFSEAMIASSYAMGKIACR